MSNTVIRKMLDFINMNGETVLLIHSPESIEVVSSDVDILIASDEFDGVRQLVSCFAEANNIRIISDYISLGGNWIVNLISFVGVSMSYRLDFYVNPYLTTYKTYPYGYFLLEKDVYFDSTINIDGILMPSYDVQFTHYLCRKILKRQVDDTVRVKLLSMYGKANEEQIFEHLKRMLNAGVDAVTDVVTGKLMESSICERLENWFRANNMYSKLTLRMRICAFLRRRNNGVHLAIIGPDGTGKTTLIDGLTRGLSNVYSEVWYVHLRPTLIPATSNVRARISGEVPTVSKPHANREYGRFVSFIKFIILIFDYTFGYYAKIYKRKRTNRMIISDRYFYDMIVDPRRFRLKVSKKMVSLVVRYFVPKPDITVFLNADPAIIYARKKDLSEDEIGRQLQEFEGLGHLFSEIVTVDAGQPPECVLEDVMKCLYFKEGMT